MKEQGTNVLNKNCGQKIWRQQEILQRFFSEKFWQRNCQSFEKRSTFLTNISG